MVLGDGRFTGGSDEIGGGGAPSELPFVNVGALARRPAASPSPRSTTTRPRADGLLAARGRRRHDALGRRRRRRRRDARRSSSAPSTCWSRCRRRARRAPDPRCVAFGRRFDERAGTRGARALRRARHRDAPRARRCRPTSARGSSPLLEPLSRAVRDAPSTCSRIATTWRGTSTCTTARLVLIDFQDALARARRVRPGAAPDRPDDRRRVVDAGARGRAGGALRSRAAPAAGLPVARRLRRSLPALRAPARAQGDRALPLPREREGEAGLPRLSARPCTTVGAPHARARCPTLAAVRAPVPARWRRSSRRDPPRDGARGGLRHAASRRSPTPTPKPLVAGRRPAAARAHPRRSCAPAASSEVVINLHHLGQPHRASTSATARASALRVRYSREDPILDTGGGIKRAEPLLARRAVRGR